MSSKVPVTLREPVTLQQRVAITPGVLDQNVGGGAVLLDVAHGLYFGLDDSGYVFWKALKNSANIEEAFLSLREEFAVGDEELKSDLLALVNELVANGLVTIVET
jgi:hypothetical protein